MCLGSPIYWDLEESLLVVVVVVDELPLGAMAELDADVVAGDMAEELALVSAGAVVVVVVSVVVVVDVADVSAFFWQAPRPQARPTANMTATVVRLVIGLILQMRGRNEHGSVMVP